MKRIITITTAILLISVLLAACDFNYNPSGSRIGSDGQIIETPPEDTQSGDSPNITEQTIDGKILSNIFDDGRIDIEYVLLGGFNDIALQDAINEEIYTFFMQPKDSAENVGKNITITAAYDIIGGKYVSMRAFDSIYADAAAYPVNNFRAITLDLETGGNAGWVDEYIKIETVKQDNGMLIGYENVGDFLVSGNFTQIYPEESFDGAVEMFADRLAEDVYSLEFYLTETSVGLCVTGLPHAVGGYLIFEADYSGMRPLLTEKLLSVLG